MSNRYVVTKMGKRWAKENEKKLRDDIKKAAETLPADLLILPWCAIGDSRIANGKRSKKGKRGK